MTTDPVILRSEDRASSLTLARLGPTEPDGSVPVRVSVATRTLRADVALVWFMPDALGAFDPARFERERSGTAVFSSLGPGVSSPPSEFSLTLDAASGGHATATVRLCLSGPSRSGRIVQEATVPFDVDGGDLPAFAEAWHAAFQS